MGLPRIEETRGKNTLRCTPEDLVNLAAKLIDPAGRQILGIVGSPGSGKSTLARQLEAALIPKAILVPMDGFHLSREELALRGTIDRMGALDTFDSLGFVDLIKRLKANEESTIFAPSFRRDPEEVIPNAIVIEQSVPLVIIEGNYLLVEQLPWSQLRPILSQTWFLDVEDDERIRRLIDRHIAYGKSPDEAKEWAFGSDQSNANIVRRTRDRADLFIEQVT